jgi:hypothetical protein
MYLFKKIKISQNLRILGEQESLAGELRPTAPYRLLSLRPLPPDLGEIARISHNLENYLV